MGDPLTPGHVVGRPRGRAAEPLDAGEERVDIGDGSTTTLDGPAPGSNPEIVADYQFGG